MGRARTIKPGFFTNDVLGEMSPLVRLLFAGMWTLADRDGRLLDRPRRIKAEILPYDKLDAEAAIAALEQHGFLLRYESDGVRCIQVANWMKHQNPHPRELPSGLPAPIATAMHDAGTAMDGTPRPDPDRTQALPRPDPDRDQVRPGRASSSSSSLPSGTSFPSGRRVPEGPDAGDPEPAASTAATALEERNSSLPENPPIVPVPVVFREAHRLLREGGLEMSGEEASRLVGTYPDRDHAAVARYLVAYAADNSLVPLRRTTTERAWRENWGADGPKTGPPTGRAARAPNGAELAAADARWAHLVKA